MGRWLLAVLCVAMAAACDAPAASGDGRGETFDPERTEQLEAEEDRAREQR